LCARTRRTAEASALGQTFPRHSCRLGTRGNACRIVGSALEAGACGGTEAYSRRTFCRGEEGSADERPRGSSRRRDESSPDQGPRRALPSLSQGGADASSARLADLRDGSTGLSPEAAILTPGLPGSERARCPDQCPAERAPNAPGETLPAGVVGASQIRAGW